MTSLARRIFRKAVPSRARRAIADLLGVDKDVTRVFSRIYREGKWGRATDFYSGDGSHDPLIVEPYVEAVRRYLHSLERPVHVVDIGCGDFNVGRRLVDCTDSYTACDIVPELIERNRERFKDPRVRFQVLNAIEDELPAGNVVCVRQVLQHLSNEHIAAIAGKLKRYPRWVITEHLPATADFEPNVDQRHGSSIRLEESSSGVVLTASPFGVRPASERVLCEVPSYGGVIRTVAYSFGPSSATSTESGAALAEAG